MQYHYDVKFGLIGFFTLIFELRGNSTYFRLAFNTMAFIAWTNHVLFFKDHQ